MKNKFVRFTLLAFALHLGSASYVRAGTAPEFDAAVALRLITAIQTSDHAAFIKDGEASFAAMKRAQFETVAAQLAPRLGRGHEVDYLGELKQRGYRVTLWKIRFKDGSDDTLASLSLKDGKVGGFWIR